MANSQTKKREVRHDMDLIKLIDQFGSDDKCRAYLQSLRFPDGVKCLRCQSVKISRIIKRNQFICDDCNYQFSVLTGTIFHDTHLPLTKWFCAVYLMCESKKGISANQLKRTLKVAYKTAWYLCHRIREAVKDNDPMPLSGVVEVDETYIGGLAKNMHKAQRAKKIDGRGFVSKTPVLGMLERDGRVRTKVIKHADTLTLQGEINLNIEPGSTVMTDDHGGYRKMSDAYIHGIINHQESYVDGDVHTNGIENVWSLFKRSIIGSYHKISEKHLDRYLDEFEHRFNNRDNKYLFRDTLIRLLKSDNLEYKELVKD
jgi:transposase-like protein